VSNLERDPAEVVSAATAIAEPADDIQLLSPREVPLGGPRARPVRRTLPQRGRSLIGPWCFLDHYGPDDVEDGHGMNVPPHPHTGLQTVSWLFAGEIEHRDSVGSHAMVRPGELNLMTAGAGIQHSEVSTPATRLLHGAQLWVALPESSRQDAPFFEHYVPQPVVLGEATLRVFLGSLAGQESTATAFSPIVGAQVDLPAGASLDLEVDPAFEHGVLLDAGELTFEGTDVPRSTLAYASAGRSSLRLAAGSLPVRALLIGGAPFAEKIVMWWNFIGRTHEEIVEYRTRWQLDVIEDESRTGRFGHIDAFDRALPAPELPNVRLKPRE
jgi:redox-sensitive bicupin YhaK (pirin superfamily)